MYVDTRNYFSVRLFAGDTSLTACGKGLDWLIHRINLELPELHKWLCANKFTLNLSKSKHIDFNIIIIYRFNQA